MRALLVVNPKATSVSARTRDVLARALASDLKVDVVETEARGHAVTLAAQAGPDGFGLVVALGGDGTVNEIVNGLLVDGPGPEVPALAVVPGGSANVFARALGVPPDPVEATSEILDALRAGRLRRLGLGRADERWFTFTAGAGLDAEVVEIVERRREEGRVATPSLYLRSAVRQFLHGTDRRHAAMTLCRPGEPDITGLFMALVGNTDPWTYLGSRPVRPCPQASFDTGLDLMALRRLGLPGTLRTARQMLSAEPRLRGRGVLSLHDCPELTLVADRPVAFQVDGDFAGPRHRVVLRSVPDALDVVA